MRLTSAGEPAELDRYIGYWEPYATGHEALDRDEALQKEVRNAPVSGGGLIGVDGTLASLLRN